VAKAKSTTTSAERNQSQSKIRNQL